MLPDSNWSPVAGVGRHPLLHFRRGGWPNAWQKSSWGKRATHCPPSIPRGRIARQSMHALIIEGGHLGAVMQRRNQCLDDLGTQPFVLHWSEHLHPARVCDDFTSGSLKMWVVGVAATGPTPFMTKVKAVFLRHQPGYRKASASLPGWVLRISGTDRQGARDFDSIRGTTLDAVPSIRCAGFRATIAQHHAIAAYPSNKARRYPMFSS